MAALTLVAVASPGGRLVLGQGRRHRGLRTSAGLFAGVSLKAPTLDADNDRNDARLVPGRHDEAIVLDLRFTSVCRDPIRQYSPIG